MEILQALPTEDRLVEVDVSDVAPALPLDDVVGPDATVPRPARAALRVERVEAPMLVFVRPAWIDLCTRVVEPNVFLDPGFALPLLQHVAVARRPSFLLIWEEVGPVFGRLMGLIPVHMGRRRLLTAGLARGFDQKLTSCGMPLVDRERAADVLAVALDWLGRQGSEDALTLSGIAADGPFATALGSACACLALERHTLEARERAILLRPDADGDRIALFASARRRKELARQRRRLSESGCRVYSSARKPEEIAAATERFLALEHAGWKGTRGTSLLADPKAATFTRAMVRVMAQRGLARIDAIEIDKRPVAMGVVLRAGDRAFFWKTAFDEAYAGLSPGVQFAADLTQAQLADPDVTMTDSCAVAGHPMIDRLWPHRMSVVDVMIALQPRTGGRFRRCLAAERLRRSLKRQLKALWASARRRGAA